MTNERADYERALSPIRERLATSRWATRVLASTPPEDLLEQFVIEIVARGVTIAEPTEEWLEDAATRCLLVGAPDLGRALRRHVNQVAGRHMLLIADTHALVARRRRQSRPTHPAGMLLGRPSTPASRRIIRIHEAAIAAPTPFGEIAVLHEIERLWTVHGLDLTARCRDVLGGDSAQSLSFLEDHRMDSVSAKFLGSELDRLLAAGHGSQLADAGAAIIEAYVAFFDECLDGALLLASRKSSQDALRAVRATPSEPPPSSRRMPPSSARSFGNSAFRR